MQMSSLLLNPKLTGNIYSTDEINTGKLWIDGKPIYRKTFTGSISSSIRTGLTGVSLVNAYGLVVTSSGAFLILPSLRVTNSNYSVGFYVSSDFIIYFEKGSGASGEAYITLEYTKTTD